MATIQKGNPLQTSAPNVPYFRGFSTVGQTNPPYTLTNIQLIKRDLYNQFATPMGSRVMLPSFGTNIYSYLFDPFDQITINNIIADATNVVNSDPRVSIVSIDVYQADQAITVAMVLLFQPEAITDSLFVLFTQADQEAF